MIKLWFFGLVVCSLALFPACNGDDGEQTATESEEEEELEDPDVYVTGPWTSLVIVDSVEIFSLVQTDNDVRGTGTTYGGVTYNFEGTVEENHLVISSGIAYTYDMRVGVDTMVGTYSDSAMTNLAASFTRGFPEDQE